MPIVTVAPAAKTVRQQSELFRIEITVSCDGTTNTIMEVKRHHRAVQRDSGNSLLTADPSPISVPYLLSDFAAGVQTGLTNFVNAIDVK